jgi:DNA polymerase-1
MTIRYLHPALKITRTVTGRKATSGFPVLGLPKHSEEGRKIRGLVVAPPGFCIYEADYSQIELRCAADLSGDKAMAAVYKKGGDIHATTGQAVFGIPKEQQDDSKHRLPSKTGNFSMLMGTSEKGLTESIHKAGNTDWSKNCPGCKNFKAPHAPNCDSLRFMESWFKTYSGVRAFMDARRKECEKTGHASGMWGEDWYLPGAWSPHEDVREQTLRQAHALPVQSGAQRLIELAMAAVYVQIPRDGSVFPMLQIHDSLAFVVLTKKVEKWHRAVKETMEGITTWKVPIIAEGKSGPTWLQQEKLS